MRRGAEEMKKVRGCLDVDQVDDVMDDIQEEMDVSQKVCTGNLNFVSILPNLTLKGCLRAWPPSMRQRSRSAMGKRRK